MTLRTLIVDDEPLARDGTLVLSVRDDGVGMPEGPRREGVGLANTRARLRQLYGARQSLELSGAPGAGTCVRVCLPLREEPT